MKKEDLFEALEDIDPASVKRAGEYYGKKRSVWTKWIAAVACVAIVAGAVLGTHLLKKAPQQEGGEVLVPSGVMALMASYPQPVSQTMDMQEFMQSDAHWQWWDSYWENIEPSRALQTGLEGYDLKLMEKVLTAEDGNTVCSPINTYLAFAMLAEVTDGNTRAQILDMLEAESIDKLRENVSTLWKSNYVDTPALKSVLANSLWLSNKVKYNEKTLENIAANYYASSFRGVPGSAEMDEALQNWTDENTGGLLKDFTKEMHIDKDTVLELLSTIYYKATWSDDFRAEDTVQETFHGAAGDTMVDMMKKTDMKSVYRTEKFSALGLSLMDSGAMYFLLPAEGVDVNTLVSDPDVLKVLQGDPEDVKWSFPIVHLSVPKFKVSGKVDLLETVRELGVTDALDYTIADFSPLTTEMDDLYLSKAEHAAMVEIDEKGVTGAAYTEIAAAEGAADPDEEIDFVLDRPFMFMITGTDGSILFSGVVRNID